MRHCKKMLLFAFSIVAFSILSSCKKNKIRDLRSEPQGAEEAIGVIGEFPKNFFKPASNFASNSNICTDKIDSDLIKQLPEKRLTDSYLNSCSGCHGTAGEGREGFPSVKNASKDKLQSIVRSGGSQMPAFPESLISNEEIEKIYSVLSSNDKLEPFDTQVHVPTTFSEIPDEEYVATMKKGLIAWRTAGERGACMSCHGPDGIDLARINYPSSAILRRALGQGIAKEKAIDIVRMINAQRSRYYMKSPCRSFAFIPFQPGDQIISGSDAEEKDKKLLDILKKNDADFYVTVNSTESAKNFIAKIAALDVTTVPIAIRLNHWTEDAFHSDSHKSTAEWLPEIPLEAKSDEDQKKWISLQNNYLQNPSDENLFSLLDGIDSLDGHRFTTGGVSERIAREKYRSVILFQHMLRFNTRKMPDLTKTKNLDRFSIWETAQISNVMARGCADGGTDDDPYPCWKYPASFYKKMGKDRTYLLTDVLKINLPWLLAGWMVDPGLQLTENGDAQMSHLHAAFEKNISTFNSTQGKFSQLPIHNIYFSFVRLVKSLEALNDKLPTGSQHQETATKGCWTNIGPGIDQWVQATLPTLESEISSTASPAISSTHQKQATSIVTTIDRTILQMLQFASANRNSQCDVLKPRNGVLSLKDVATKIKDWHAKNKIPDDLIDKLASDFSK